MNKQKAALAILLVLFIALFINNIKGKKVRRVNELTYQTPVNLSSNKNSTKDVPMLKKELLTSKGEKFRKGGKDIFAPLSFRRPKPKTKAKPKPDEGRNPIILTPGSLELLVGEESQVVVGNAKGKLSVSFAQPGIAETSGEASPLTILCTAGGTTVVTVTDGKSSATLSVICTKPIDRELPKFTFLGFLESEKTKTIFLSRKDQILIVKKGDTILKKGGNIENDYIIKSITEEVMIITSADGSEILEIRLVENQPLRR